MINIWKRSLLLLLLVTGCIIIAGQNMLLNGNYSQGLKDWEVRLNNTDAKAVFTVTDDQIENQKSILKVHVTDVVNDYWAFKFHHIEVEQSGFSINRFDVFKLSLRTKGFGSNLLLQIGLARKNNESSDFYQLDDHAMVNIPVSGDWQHHEIELISSETTGDVRFVMRFGEKTGTYFIDDVKLEKVSEFRDKNWMKNVDARIDSLRKGRFKIVVLENNDHPVPKALVTIRLANHKFMWGTSVYLVTPEKWNKNRYNWERQEILKTFNTIVNEDDFKWPQMEPRQGKVIYKNVDLYTEWASENNIRMRGHCLVWPKKGVYLPEWFEALPEQHAKQALKKRIQREMKYYSKNMCEYDVLNEPVHNPFLEEWLGDSIYHYMFTWARQADPSARLYVNEWWNFDYWDHYRFRLYVDSLIADKTPLDGLGLQGHMDRPFNWLQFKFKLDYLAEAGLPLKITEFDINVDELGLSPEEHAQYYHDMMHLAFSHPAINGFLIWGLTDGWRDNSGIYNDDFTPRPAAGMMHHLIKEKWNTDTTGMTNSNGAFGFYGFKGDYEIIIKSGNDQKKYRITLDDENPQYTISLN